MKSLGQKLKAFRKESNLTLKDSAEALQVSTAFLSMVENGKSGIRFENLHRLLKLYGKNLGDLTESPTSQETLNTASASVIAEEPGVTLYGLSSHTHHPGGYMGGFLMRIEPGASNVYDSHNGLEYVYIIKGSIRLILKEKNGEHTIDMNAGDTETHPAQQEHIYYNIGTIPAEVLIIECSPLETTK